NDEDFVTLVESECDALERLRRILRAARYAEANAKGCKELEAEINERRQRFENKAESPRAIVKQAMGTLGLSRLDAPDFTASLSAGKPSLSIEEEAIPSQLCKLKKVPDAAAIRRALEQGEPIPGAELLPATPVLTVRVR